MKKRFNLNILLIIFATFSFIVTSAESIIYYNSTQDILFRLLLIIQNCINTFKFTPMISLEDSYAFISSCNSVPVAIIGYLYAVSVFLSPLCTVAAVYKALEKVFSAALGLRDAVSGKRVLIFGYNEDVEALIRTNERYNVHIITNEELNTEEKYKISKKGCRIHCVDMFTASENERCAMIRKAKPSKTSRILLFHEDPSSNFSLLQMLLSDKSIIKADSKAKIICRCDYGSVRDLINKFYKAYVNNGDKQHVDLELVSIQELRVRQMYEKCPLHSFYLDTDTKLADCGVKMLIAGFGRLGQQAALQAMNLGILHKDNHIEIDIFDTDMDNKRERFLALLDMDQFERNGNSVRVKSRCSDGELIMNFSQADMTHSSFIESVSKRKYTYAAIFSPAGTELALRLARNRSFGKVPILLEMNNNERLAEYIDKNTPIRIIPDRDSVFTFRLILSDEIDIRAKQTNYFYDKIYRKADKNDDGRSDEKDEIESINLSWEKLSLFKRESSKATTYRIGENKEILRRFCREYSADYDKTLDRVLNSYELQDENIIRMIRSDKMLYEMLAMEHRRWCCFMLSLGWRYADIKDEDAKESPYIIGEEAIIENHPAMVKYDFQPFLYIAHEREHTESDNGKACLTKQLKK